MTGPGESGPTEDPTDDGDPGDGGGDPGGGDPDDPACAGITPTGFDVGAVVHDFALLDSNGEEHTLHEHCTKVVVLVAGAEW